MGYCEWVEGSERNGRPPCVAFRCSACAALRHAAVAAALERGIEGATDAAIAERAGMSVADLRRHYHDAEECLGFAYEEGVRQLERTFRDGLRGAGSWRERLRAAADRTLAAFSKRPQLARFCLAEVPRTSVPSLRERHLASRQRFVTALAEERGPDAGDPPRVHLELVTGAAHHAVGTHLAGERCDLDSIRVRIDHLISHFVRTPA
jgi:AcrR family transcriptional regulator